MYGKEVFILSTLGGEIAEFNQHKVPGKTLASPQKFQRNAAHVAIASLCLYLIYAMIWHCRLYVVCQYVTLLYILLCMTVRRSLL